MKRRIHGQIGETARDTNLRLMAWNSRRGTGNRLQRERGRNEREQNADAGLGRLFHQMMSAGSSADAGWGRHAR